MTDGDGVDEAFSGLSRVALTAAGRAGEAAARARQQTARDAEARSLQAANEMAARLDAEREAARATLRLTQRDEWWIDATPEQVQHAYETASAWSEYDAAGREDLDRLAQEIKDRRGIDPTASSATEEAAEVAVVMSAADRVDRAAEYDSKERREQLARELNGLQVGPAAEARVVADVAQGKPASDAVTDVRTRAPRARRTRGAVPQISRGEQSR